MTATKYIKKNSPTNKYKILNANSSLVFEFQTETVKLLIFNYVVILLIANHEIGWNYTFNGVDIANRLGQELFEPVILTKFGFFFRMSTIIVNTLTVTVIVFPKRKFCNFLLIPILWNFYIIAAITENILETIWTMFFLEVPYVLFSTILTVGIFMVCLQSKLMLQKYDS